MSTSYTGKGWMTIDLVGAVAHAGGEICNLLNPEGEALIITRVALYSTHVSTGASSLNVGIGTTAQHDQTELISGEDLAALTAGTAVTGYATGDASDALVVWGATEYLVANGAAASDTSGFTGRLHVEYIHA